MAEKLCEEADVGGCSKSPSQGKRDRRMDPPPHNKLFLCIPNYQNILLMAGEWGQQEEKAR
jgi:hypothetical protein